MKDKFPELKTKVRVLCEETYDEKISKPSDMTKLADNFLEKYSKYAYKVFPFDIVMDEFDDAIESGMQVTEYEYDHNGSIMVLEFEIDQPDAKTVRIHYKVSAISM